MANEAIEERLVSFYKVDRKTSQVIDIENALKELAQEIALRGLALSGFFRNSAFHGGTCLRIIHRSQRFSEDLDFALDRPMPDFDIAPHMNAVMNELAAFGLHADVQDRGRVDTTVAKTFVRMQSVGNILSIEEGSGRRKKIRIKIEVDTNPPAGQKTEIGSVLWPSAFPVVVQDMPTLFSGKLHALLCRAYEKGRDWYDLVWYLQRRAQINYVHLKNALVQTGHADAREDVNRDFVESRLKERLDSLNFKDMLDDVRPLVKDRREIDLWTKEMFFNAIERI